MKARKDRRRVTIRKYRLSDKRSIIKLMDKFGDYLAEIDSMKRQRRMPKFGEHFTEKSLREAAKNNGVVYVAEHGGQIIAFITGAIAMQSRESLLECIPTTRGEISELFVDQGFRGKGIGTALMKKMEEHFRKKGCDVSGVEVFEPNVEAHQFYSKLRYRDRSFYMMKKL